nr:tyrosine-protein phosphatase non-receptor type 4-like [Lytechinus pictus]
MSAGLNGFEQCRSLCAGLLSNVNGMDEDDHQTVSLESFLGVFDDGEGWSGVFYHGPDTEIKILRPQIITVEGRLGNNGRAPAGHGGSSGRHHARSNSGSYNVRSNEMVREKQERRMRCLVEFLDNSEQIFEVERRAKGQELLDRVFEHLELLECDYFGLRYSETDNTVDCNNKRWLDPRKSIRKQVKGTLYFHFQVKFFVTDPSKLLEEYTRYQYVLQLKKDLLEGRSPLGSMGDMEGELGGRGGCERGNKMESEGEGRMKEETRERGIKRMEKRKRGRDGVGQGTGGGGDEDPHSCNEFFRSPLGSMGNTEGELGGRAGCEDTLGSEIDIGVDTLGSEIDIGVDTLGSEIDIGVVSAGLSIFQNGVRINQFSWAKIVKISFKRKQFFIQQRREIGETRDMVIGFNMTSYRACKNLWKSCVEHHTFFRMVDPQPPAKRRTFFQLGSKFRYSGRTESQTMEETKKRLAEKEISRSSPNKRAFRRTIGGTVAEVIRTETRSLPSRTTQKYKPLKDNHRVPSFDGKIPPSPNGKPR